MGDVASVGGGLAGLRRDDAGAILRREHVVIAIRRDRQLWRVEVVDQGSASFDAAVLAVSPSAAHHLVDSGQGRKLADNMMKEISL